jgi:hypothetical protein
MKLLSSFVLTPLAIAFSLANLVHAQPATPPVPSASNSNATTGDEVLGMVKFDQVSLRDAVNILAKQARLKIQLDPALPSQDANLEYNWKKVTARQALQALFENYGWQMTASRDSVVRISVADPNAAHPPRKVYHLLEGARTNSDQILPDVSFDQYPLGDAIRRFSLQAGVNILFDPQLAKRETVPESQRWHNITARQALQSLLDIPGWQMTQIPGNPILRIVAKTPPF